MKTTTAAGWLAALLLVADVSSVRAGEPASTMAALEESIQPGTEVDVVDRQGRLLRGSFVRADEEGVLVTPYGSAEGRRVPAGEVMTVLRPGDSLRNGALIGAAAGILTAIAVATDETGASGCYTTGCKVGFSAFAVGAYTGIGMLIDRAVKGRTVAFRAPAGRVAWSVSPHPVPRGAGLRVGLAF